MRHIGLKIAALAVMGSVVGSALCGSPSHAESPAIRNCTWCHGGSAQGYAPAPRLAGQTPRYIATQMMSFREHTRNSPFSKQYMWAAAANLSPQAVQSLAMYFASLPRRAADDGDRERAAEGRAIYREGVPQSNIVACIACHGPDAEGAGEIPRLGGLAYTYVKRRLQQWDEGYRGALDRPMPHIARNLSPNQIEALASYLSFAK